jgi:acetyl esterase
MMEFDPSLLPYASEAQQFGQRETTATSISAVDFASIEALQVTRQRLHAPSGPTDSSALAVETLTVPGGAEDLTVRIVQPDRCDAVYLHFHMGGWVVGSARSSDPRSVEIANNCGVAVVSVDYRLAPEWPYPAQIEDAQAVWAWLSTSGGQRFGTDRIIIGGESAGATLAAQLLLRVRDSGGDLSRFCAANLVYGVFDFSATPSHRGSTAKAISDEVNRHAFGARTPEELRHPSISPLYADLAGLPPALFSVGGADSLLDDTLFMAARWKAAGNEATLHIFPECGHGFEVLPIEMAAVARSRMDAFIRAHLGH